MSAPASTPNTSQQRAKRLQTYIADADWDGDSELADLFRKAQAESRKGAEQGKTLLKARLNG